MERTSAEIEALRAELQGWMGTNGLADDVEWLPAAEYYGGEAGPFPTHHHFVLIAEEGRFHDILSGLPDDATFQRSYQKLKREFEAILNRHRAWYEKEDDATTIILSEDRLV